MQSRTVIFDVHGVANIAPLASASLLGAPVIWHYHESVKNFFLLSKIGRLFLSNQGSRLIVVASKSAVTYKLENYVTIPAGVDVNFWRPSTNFYDHNVLSKRLKILAVANLNPLKGLDILLASLEQISQPCEVRVIGSELDTHKKYVQQLRLHVQHLEKKGHTVLFEGWQPREFVHMMHKWADIFVLPSRSEACPIALLEAMSSGCACIATNVGDVPDILLSPECGFVVDSGDADALATAIVKVASLGINGRRSIGQRARDRIVAVYSLQKMAERHLEIYNSLI